MGIIKVLEDRVVVEMNLDELLFLATYIKLPDGKTYRGGLGNLIGHAADLLLQEKAKHLSKLYHHTKIEGEGVVTVSYFKKE